MVAPPGVNGGDPELDRRLSYDPGQAKALLTEAGYRVVVPDLRGFGRSDVPDDLAAYGIDVLSRDVLCLLDEVASERGVLIGHDWGSDVAWKTAWLHPERVLAIAYFQERYSGGEPITTRDLADAYQHARVKRPQNFPDVIATLVRKGYLVEQERREGLKSWGITGSGACSSIRHARLS